MKKTLIAFVAILLTSSIVTAQQDLFTSMKNMGSEVKYKEFDLTGSDADGYTFTSASEYFTIKVDENRFGRASGFTTYHEDGTKSVDWGTWKKPDHYTHPMYLSDPASTSPHKDFIVMADSVVYQLRKLSEDGSTFDIKRIWIPIFEKEEKAEETTSEEPKKKMTMKEKLATAKAKVTNYAAGGAYGEFFVRQKTVKHVEVVTNYIAAMKKVQVNNPITGEAQEELDGLEADKVAEAADIEATNNAYWASEEGQRQLAQRNQADVTIFNDTQSDFLFCHGSGVSVFLEPGKSYKLSCSGGSITKGTKISNNNTNLKDTGEVLLERDGTSCGKLVKASTL